MAAKWFGASKSWFHVKNAWFRRRWPPRMGGKRKCIQCGFLHQDAVELDLLHLAEVPQSVRDAIARGEEFPFGRVSTTMLRCERHVWDYTARGWETEAMEERPCALFFPYQEGVSPTLHLELRKEASARWWTLWAVLAATGLGGSISGLLVGWLR